MSKKLYNNPNLQIFIEREEDGNFEKKGAKIQPKDLAREFSAFANSSVEGGLVVVGIKNDTEVEGLNSVGIKKKNKLIQTARTFCPEISIEHKIFELENKKGEDDELLLFYVHFSRDKVIELTDGTAYERVGDQTRELFPERKRLMEQDKGQSRFGEELVSDLTLEDLNKEKIKDFIDGWTERDSLTKKPSFQEAIVNQGFGREEESKIKINNAGLLLFYDKPHKFIPGARIRFLRYEGREVRTGTESNIIKDKFFKGPLTQQIEDASDMVKTQIKEFSFLNDNGQFTTVPEYPPFAWKELIVNAVAHRAYNIKNTEIFIRMFDNRLEILSPGALPHIVNVDNIYKQTYPRNPLIMEALLCLDYVKKASEGLDRVKEEMNKMDLPDPEFDNNRRAGQFKITLYNNIQNRRRTKEVKEMKKIKSDLFNKCDEDQQKIIKFLVRNKEGATSDFIKVTEKSRGTVRRKVRKLEKKGIVKRNKKIGPNVKYILTNRIYSESEDESLIED